MWSLIIVTVLSIDPPSYYYNPVAVVETFAQCQEMAASVQKSETGKPTRVICVRTK